MSDRYLIIGAGGQLGRALQTQYPQAYAVDYSELNIADPDSINEFDWSGYDVIFNAAAWTNVDAAEDIENREAVWRVNALGPWHLSQMAEKHDFTLFHISTDYVFNGEKEKYTEQDAFSPLSVYGASKAVGDLAVSLLEKHYILRTSWVIGDGKNFVRTMVNLAQKGVSPKVVNDQKGRLTFTKELVRAIDYLNTHRCKYGAYNMTGAGNSATWHEIAQEIFSYCGRDKDDVAGVSTSEYYKNQDNVALRPKNSTLDLTKIVSEGLTPVDWKNDLQKYLQLEGVL